MTIKPLFQGFIAVVTKGKDLKFLLLAFVQQNKGIKDYTNLDYLYIIQAGLEATFQIFQKFL